MGVKMKKARFNGKTVDLDNYKDYMKGNLRCHYCDAKVTYVRAHIKLTNNKETEYSSYYRLMNGNSAHTSDCKYITANIIKEIFAKTTDDIITQDKNRYVVRLQVITNKLDIINNKDDLVDKNQLIDDKPTRKYIKNGENVAYLSTLKKIINLKNALDDYKELRDLVKLQFYNSRLKNTEEVSWKSFYMEDNIKSYIHIYRIIENKADHPICFEGTIKDVSNYKNKYFIKFYSVKREPGVYYAFSAITSSIEVYESARKLKGKKVVVYGCGHAISKDGTKNGTVFHNFFTYINLPSQLFKLDD